MVLLNFFEFQEECLPITELNLDRVHACSINIRINFFSETKLRMKNFYSTFFVGRVTSYTLRLRSGTAFPIGESSFKVRRKTLPTVNLRFARDPERFALLAVSKSISRIARCSFFSRISLFLEIVKHPRIVKHSLPFGAAKLRNGERIERERKVLSVVVIWDGEGEIRDPRNWLVY